MILFRSTNIIMQCISTYHSLVMNLTYTTKNTVHILHRQGILWLSYCPELNVIYRFVTIDFDLFFSFFHVYST